MVTDGGLVLGELCGEVTDAERLWLLNEKIEHAQPGGIGNGLELRGQGGRSRLAHARCGNRRAAGLVLVPERNGVEKGCGCHTRILADASTFVNVIRP